MPRIVSAADAVKVIPDNAVVAVNSSSGLNCPDAVLKALGERFDQHGSPRNLTMLHPIAAGDMFGIRGVEHIAKRGLIGRIIGGSYPSGPSTSEPPMIWQMLGADEMPAYNVPSGIMFDMMREAAAKRPGVITKVGLDTFVDPDHEGRDAPGDAPEQRHEVGAHDTIGVTLVAQRHERPFEQRLDRLTLVVGDRLAAEQPVLEPPPSRMTGPVDSGERVVHQRLHRRPVGGLHEYRRAQDLVDLSVVGQTRCTRKHVLHAAMV